MARIAKTTPNMKYIEDFVFLHHVTAAAANVHARCCFVTNQMINNAYNCL